MKFLLLFFALFASSSLLADLVTPSDRVSRALNIRDEAVSGASIIGRLTVGERAKYVSAHSRYYEIKTNDGVVGFVSKGYAKLIPEDDFLTIITWNLEGPSGIDNKDLSGFSAFSAGADIITLEEVLGTQQVNDALQAAEMTSDKASVSDFAKDSYENPYKKQELAVLTGKQTGTVIEVDPYASDDTEEMREKDVDFDVPGFIPSQQRSKKGARGWLWVEIPELKLVVAAVHLKSSQGASGKDDETNSWKRENVTAGLGVTILEDSKARPDWSYVVAGDFNVAPGDTKKVGVDLNSSCTEQQCDHYDQTHALLGGGLIHGLSMRNLVVGLSNSYASGAFVKARLIISMLQDRSLIRSQS